MEVTVVLNAVGSVTEPVPVAEHPLTSVTITVWVPTPIPVTAEVVWELGFHEYV